VKNIHPETGGWFLEAPSVMTNFRAKVTNSIAKGTNSIAKWTNSIAKATNSFAKTCNVQQLIAQVYRQLTASILIKHLATPIMDKQPISTKSRERNDHSMVMNCSATGLGPIHYRWEKYDLASEKWIRPSHRAMSITSPKLTFSAITEEDEGVYHCAVTNDDGSVVSDNATLTVYGKEYASCCANIIAFYTVHL